ncbi:hypothetical protein OsJ_02063 [Oryza sativa Japonica Group]|uniref:Uncharacterized protein n=1 Tax=Oryza sativa subsp. japonica TaxID=39947 RepID=B9EXB0_ORYSJ|nr:hypothetical protein OsJ_02063 [Oryza sativa Japonica Group]
MAGAAATLALSKAEQCGVSVRLSRPSPHRGADDATRCGHLGLVRAHPGLRDLNAALTTTTTSGGSADASFFLDAAHALAASALRVPTITGGAIRLMGDSKAAVHLRLELATLHAREGRLDEALAAAVQLARDNPGDIRPRLAAAALCCLHGRSGTAFEWLKSVPESARRFKTSDRFVTIVVYAMPGSSPQRVEEGVDGMVVDVAAAIAEDTLSMKLEEGEWSTLERLELAVLGRLLRRFVSKRFAAAAYPEFKSWTWTRPPPPPINATESQLNKALVLCSQAMLAPVLGARPLCGERLREVRAVADAEAEADASAAVVDVNLLLAFLAIRDGRFDEAMQRYRAAVARDPSDRRAYELAAALCSIAGHAAEERDAWLRGEERHCDRGRGATAGRGGGLQLQALLDEQVVAAALGLGGDRTARDPHRGRVLAAAWREVDAGLAAALRDGDHLTMAERAQLRGLRCVLRAKMQPLLDTAANSTGPDNSPQQRSH